MDKFQQALQHLLPTGYAWPRDPDSTLMRLLTGFASAFSELQAVVDQETQQWLPHLATRRLAEWEEATGLPSSCYANQPTVKQRRKLLLSRLRGASGFYVDSSPASTAAVEAICANMGLPASVHCHTRFRVGRDRVGRRVGEPDGKIYIVLASPGEVFRVGRAHVADRLIDRPDVAALACYLALYLPARFELQIIFPGDS